MDGLDMTKIFLTVCLLVFSIALPAWASITPIKIYYIPESIQSEYYTCRCISCQSTAIIDALSPFYSVTRGVPFQEFDGSQNLGTYNVVLFTNSVNYIDDMPESGQIALKDFVVRGGGLITGEWVMWSVAYHIGFSTLASVLPVSPTTDVAAFETGTYTQATPNSVLNYRMPSSFTFPQKRAASDRDGYLYETETKISAKPEAQIFYSSANYPGGAGLVGWSYGDGRVLDFSTCIAPEELSDMNYKRLLVNSVAWAAKANAPSIPSLNSALYLLLE
jgi:hypothetical protein